MVLVKLVTQRHRQTVLETLLFMHTEPSYSFIHADMLEVMNSHAVILSRIVSRDLTNFSNKFVEKGFITRSATDEVLSQHAVGNSNKASQILEGVKENYDYSLKRQEWAEKFISTFSSEAAYRDFAETLRRGAVQQ